MAGEVEVARHDNEHGGGGDDGSLVCLCWGGV
jgi:hypothetical protein